MKSFSIKKLCTLLGLLGLANVALAAEPFGSASLLPMPSVEHRSPLEQQQRLPTTYTTVTTSYGYDDEGSPSDLPPTYAPLPAPKYPPSQEPSYAPSQAPFASPSPAMSGQYKQAMETGWDGYCGSGDPNCCGPVACGRPCPKFFGFGGGLILGRANQSNHTISQEGISYDTILGTDAASQDVSGGFEAGFGYILPNCCNAIGVTYWGLYPDDQMASVSAPNYMNPIRPALGLNLDQVWYDDSQGNNRSVQDWMTTTTGIHYISRSFDYNSVEINLFGNTQAWGLVPFGAGCGGCNGCNPCGGCGPSRFQFGWLGGVRWFGLGEGLRMQTDYNDTMVGDAGDYDELTYNLNTYNSLLGVQFGGQGSFYMTKCLSLYSAGRFGVYNNHITTDQALYGLGGDATINTGTYAGTAYRFDSSKDAIATMGQLDIGSRYQLGCHWSIYSGYRVVAISGVATAPSQINQNFSDPSYINRINADDTVILHGAYFGAQFAW